MNSKYGIIGNPKINRILYILLLIATPFLLLQNYLQSVIGEFSNLTYRLGDTDIPVTVTIAVVLIFGVIATTYKKINRLRVISWFVVILLFWIGQKSTDFYFNHKFYELQYNWHYFAYAIFSYINYRALKTVGAPPQKVILLTFISALATSTLDEFLQMPLSNRIFDVGDISKDVWGSVIGLFIIYFILENGSILKNGWRITHPRIKNYLDDPLTLLLNLFILSYLFMVVASVLTETEYIVSTILFSFGMFSTVFIAIHLIGRKKSRIITISIIVLLFVIQGVFIILNFNNGITYNKNNILVYKGIPVYYFDVMIHPDGMFRLVDKKEVFNQRDQKTIFDLSNNIIVFGTGTGGEGGQGFPSNDVTQFVFDETTLRGKQIILQKNDDACNTFNRLIKEGKRPTFIYHNN